VLGSVGDALHTETGTNITHSEHGALHCLEARGGKDASTLLVFALQRLGVTVAGVYRQLLYRHCSEPLEHMTPVDRADRARETVHIYGGTRNGVRALVVWTHLVEVGIANCSVYFAMSLDMKNRESY
jgi:hypothetical protein